MSTTELPDVGPSLDASLLHVNDEAILASRSRRNIGLANGTSL